MRHICLVAFFLAVSAAKAFAEPGQPDDETDERTDIDYDTIVKALIDAGTCANTTTNHEACGTNATSYYSTFIYNGQRVVVISGAPNTYAEVETYVPASEGGYINPNKRCEIWQYSVLPESPVKSNTTNWSNYTLYPYYGMGTAGFAVNGGAIFDTRSDPPPDVAWYWEYDTLDTCLGHSDVDKQYHHHGIPLCIPNDTWQASNASACQFVGYMLDGFPIYGRCKDTSGTELQSCWTNNTYPASSLEDYSYGSTADGSTCYLDEANGYTFTSGQTSDGYTGYGYVTTTAFSAVPIALMGSEFGEICGFTPYAPFLKR